MVPETESDRSRSKEVRKSETDSDTKNTLAKGVMSWSLGITKILAVLNRIPVVADIHDDVKKANDIPFSVVLRNVVLSPQLCSIIRLIVKVLAG